MEILDFCFFRVYDLDGNGIVLNVFINVVSLNGSLENILKSIDFVQCLLIGLMFLVYFVF